MKLEKYRQTLIYMLKTLCENGIVEPDDAAMVFHLMKTEEEAKELIQFLVEHPEVTTQMLYQKAVKIAKVTWVTPEQWETMRSTL